ncbi:ParA family protein [Candidatus Clavichlamydia salmonicola]|uniref:ParA family protein n=1 Tax=Candidatus Clavichlamydia salmonicola TaxID=469812 RepID=UPI001891A47F|nr:ParA family protein [Candidatus Clavichlamydia salmonicola]
MVKIVNFCSFKGGTAKTSSVLNIASCLSFFENKKILMLDFDPQSNLSIISGCNPSQFSIIDVLLGRVDIKDAIQKTFHDNLNIIPSTSSLEQLSYCHSSASFKSLYQQLENILSNLVDYDFCFIDTPPSLGWISQATFYSANYSIICITPDPLSLIGLQKIKEYLTTFVGKKIHDVLGVIISMWDNRSSMNPMCLDVVENIFPNKTFKIKIRKDICVSRSVVKRLPVICVFPNSRATEDFKNLSREILKGLSGEPK